MLKDLRESKRISSLIADEEKAEMDKLDLSSPNSAVCFPVRAYILSSEYWPEFHNEQFKLPDSLAPSFAKFAKLVYLLVVVER